jgi:hypothetical protein
MFIIDDKSYEGLNYPLTFTIIMVIYKNWFWRSGDRYWLEEQRLIMSRYDYMWDAEQTSGKALIKSWSGLQHVAATQSPKWKYWTYWKCCWNRHGMCHASIAYYVMNAGKHDWCTAYCSSKITQVVILYDCVFALSPEWHPCSQLLLDASYFDDECITAVKQE